MSVYANAVDLNTLLGPNFVTDLVYSDHIMETQNIRGTPGFNEVALVVLDRDDLINRVSKVIADLAADTRAIAVADSKNHGDLTVMTLSLHEAAQAFEKINRCPAPYFYITP